MADDPSVTLTEADSTGNYLFHWCFSYTTFSVLLPGLTDMHPYTLHFNIHQVSEELILNLIYIEMS